MDNQPAAAAPSTNTPEVPMVPATWPGAFGVFKHSKRAVKVNVWPILLLSILNFAFSASGGYGDNDDLSTTVLALSLVASLLSFWVMLAQIVLYFAGIRNEKLGFGPALKQSSRFILRSIGATILTVIFLALSFLAFVIPFFFVLPRLTLVNYYIVDRNAGVMEAIKLSWEETKGHSLKVWGIIAVTILFAILCVVLIGIYFLFFYQAAFAILYAYLAKSKPAAVEAPAAAAVDPATTPAEQPAAPGSPEVAEAESVASAEPETSTNPTPTPPAAA
jgi:hypothetical protein